MVSLHSILQWLVRAGNCLPGVTVAMVVGASWCVVLLRPGDVVVPAWSRSFGASMEHLPNVDRLVSMVFEVLREGCEVAANESKPGFKVSNMCCVWPSAGHQG